MFLFRHRIYVKFGITKMQRQKIFSNQFLVLTCIFQGKTVNQKVNILNECLLNVFHNFIPNKKVKFNYKNPLWMTEIVKSKLRERSNLVKRYYKNGKKKY